jgi:prepilin-type N-terminal cleavage/methylation domain-containing protein
MRSMKLMGAPADRDGFTLVELLVVLVLIGLAFVLVAPSVITQSRGGQPEIQRVIDGARRLALQRAEALTLSIDASGEWRILAGAALDGNPLRAGVLEAPDGGFLRVRISALGACVLAGAVPPQPGFDTVRCRVADE